MEIKSSKTLGYGNINTHLEYLYIFTLFDLDDFNKESFLTRIDSGEKSGENGFGLLKIKKEGEKVYFEKHGENYYIYNKKVFNIKNNSEINGNDYLYRNGLFGDLFKMHSFISLGIVEFYKNNGDEYFNITNKGIEFINELKLILGNNFSKYNKDYIKSNEQKLYNIFKDFFIDSFIYKRITEFSSLNIDDIINDLSNVNDENYKITFDEINELKKVGNINYLDINLFFILFGKYHGASGKNANNRIAYIKSYLDYFEFIKKGKYIGKNNKVGELNNKIQEPLTEYNSNNKLSKLKEYIKQDNFFDDIKIGNINGNKYFQLGLKGSGKINEKGLHFEIIIRKKELFLEIHFESKNNNNFQEKLLINNEKYEWFDWHDGKSIKNKESFQLKEENFEKIKKALIKMYNDFNEELKNIINKNTKSIIPKSSKMINNLTSQESLLLLSLLTKPFSILYGVSGTGKSRVVKELWKKMYGENYLDYFQKESVPPNWFDESEVLGRYNEIEKYKEGSFIKILEKAIKNKENNYVYLLDEMNLSHIEQYFAQYLSAIEELNDDNAWIHVGDVSDYTRKRYLEISNRSEVIIDIQNPIKLSNKYDFVKASININGEEIYSEKDFSDFHVKLFKYIVDNFLNEEIDDDKIGLLGFETIDSIKEKGYEIGGEEKIDLLGDKGFTVYRKKEGLKRTINYYFYKGYLIYTMHNYDTRIGAIKKLISVLGEELYKKTNIVFSDKNNNVSDSSKNIIEYKDSEGKIVGKSLKIPKNLFVVGTINLDETTKSISPKVVDRANLIEFNDIGDFLGIEDKESRYKLDFLDDLSISDNFEKSLEIREEITKLKGVSELPEKYKLDEKGDTLKTITKLYAFLKVFKLHFSYRTIKEIIIFVLIGKELLKEKGIENLENKLFDIAIMQKVLPKLNGVIDYNLKLYLEDNNHKNNKYLWYNIDDSLFNDKIKKDISKGFYNKKEDFTNSAIKLERMQQFFDTYQNINYFLS